MLSDTVRDRFALRSRYYAVTFVLGGVRFWAGGGEGGGVVLDGQLWSCGSLYERLLQVQCVCVCVCVCVLRICSSFCHL